MQRNIARAWAQAAAELTGLAEAHPTPVLAPTPRDVVATEGTASLLRFRAPRDRATGGIPLLLVPSMINRWYVMDLREGASLCAALVAGGVDTWCLDWGIPEDEDRHRSWTDVLDRLARMVRRVKRATGATKVGLLGYCMGGTLSTIHAALHNDDLALLVDLAGPIDFSQGGMLRRMVDPRWFDADAIADAGNVAPSQMQAGFTALRPTLDLAKYIHLPELIGDPKAQTSFKALDAWASDNIPFPGEAYRTYITELYQQNALIHGTHYVRGRRVDLKDITCPALAIVADRDAICPCDSATALVTHVGSTDTKVIKVAGGHVGAVVGSRAAREMYPALVEWLRPRLAIAPPH
ncbi:MAG TPA: alpha/beta fold hydrolase [Kofleriaceae bacterium]|nr:alpha/beta fold hydrolase [Kofleriaceae bacterium]